MVELPRAHVLDRERDVVVADGRADALDDRGLVEVVGRQSGRTKIVLHSFHGSMQVQMLTRSSLPGVTVTNSAPER